MKRIMMMLVLALSGASMARAQNIAGDWQGAIEAGGQKRHVVIHIIKGADGNLTGTMDSVDQPDADGIPITSIGLKDTKLTFSVSTLHGSYEGTVAGDGSAINGTWTQGGAIALNFKRAVAIKATDIDGVWTGTIGDGAVKKRVAFHIANREDGLSATMDSLDENVKGIPVSSVVRDGSTLTMEMKQIGGKFVGTIDKDLSTINGNWSQGEASIALVLKRTKDAAALELRRPQMPAKPYPYREETVTYDNKAAAGVTLAATLTVPEGKGPFPAVLLICGSGPHDRDETIFGHKPFLVLADYLTRKGVVVLRADKRGFAKSTGNYATATTADFATDAEAGLAYLMARPEVDHHKIGLIGHSEGGDIAPMVAARNHDVAFIVMMAGPGVRGDEIIIKQGQLIAEAEGQGKAEAAAAAEEERKVLTMVEQAKDDASLEKDLRQEFNGKVPESQMAIQIKQATSPWFRYFLTYDPSIALQQVKCPVLAIIGSKDLQVPAGQNLPAIRKALAAGGNQHADVEELQGLNHLFQPAKTGSPSEYGQIEETMSPVALEKIASWVLKQ